LLDFQPFTLVFLRISIAALILVGVGVLGEVMKVFEYAGMGSIFIGLIIIDGRALKWLQRITGQAGNEKGEEVASKVKGCKLVNCSKGG
jgi:hypothetical protein